MHNTNWDEIIWLKNIFSDIASPDIELKDEVTITVSKATAEQGHGASASTLFPLSSAVTLSKCVAMQTLSCSKFTGSEGGVKAVKVKRKSRESERERRETDERLQICSSSLLHYTHPHSRRLFSV